MFPSIMIDSANFIIEYLLEVKAQGKKENENLFQLKAYGENIKWLKWIKKLLLKWPPQESQLKNNQIDSWK